MKHATIQPGCYIILNVDLTGYNSAFKRGAVCKVIKKTQIRTFYGGVSDGWLVETNGERLPILDRDYQIISEEDISKYE